jgi:hypothetical protein
MLVYVPVQASGNWMLCMCFEVLWVCFESSCLSDRWAYFLHWVQVVVVILKQCGSLVGVLHMRVVLYDGNLVFLLQVVFGRMDSLVCGMMVNDDDLLIPDDGVLPMVLNPNEGYNHCHMVPDDF